MTEKYKNANKTLHISLVLAIFAMMSVSFSPVICYAEDTASKTADSRVEDILGDFYDSIPGGNTDISDGAGVSEALGVKRILAAVVNAVKDSSGELSALFLSVMGVALIGSLPSLYDGEISSHVSRAVGIAGAALMLDKLISLADAAISSLGEINSFFGAVIPISLAINSLGASPTTASTQAFGMGLTLSAYSFVTEKLLGGVVGAVFVTSALSGADPFLARLSRTVKGVFTWGLGVVTLLLGATFSLQSTLSASTDSLAVRGAKYAISSTIPLVGNAVSGALGIMGGGVTYARGIVGGGAVAVILSLVIAPLVTLLLYRLCIWLGMTVSSYCALGCEGVLSSFIGALDSVIAVYAMTAVIYVVELTAFLKGGVSLA